VDGDDWLWAGRTVLDWLAVHRPDVLVVGHDEVAEGGTPACGDGFEPVRGVAAPIRPIDRPDLLRLAQRRGPRLPGGAYLTELGLRFRPGWYEDSSVGHPLLIAAARIVGAMHGFVAARRGTAPAADVPIPRVPASSSSYYAPQRRVLMGLVAAPDVGDKGA
jgi:hypothetical protein